MIKVIARVSFGEAVLGGFLPAHVFYLMKTIVYVDGFNLYYGCLKNTDYKWLDLQKLAKNVLHVNNQILEIKYFTAKVTPTPHDPQKASRQDVYLKALKTIPNLSIYTGFFLTKETAMPVSPNANPPYKNKMIKVIKTEEKGSDVNLASHVIHDAYQNKMDCAVIITGDSDFLEPIKILKTHLGKIVGIVNPQKNPTQALIREATFYKHIKTAHIKNAQFPSAVYSSGRTITKPASW